MSYKKHMLEGPHPLAGILIFLPADIQFAQIDWHVSATIVPQAESNPQNLSGIGNGTHGNKNERDRRNRNPNSPVETRSRPVSCCTQQRPANNEPGDDNSDRCPLPILGRPARRP
jgi:hypothetical protein